jgi:ubiquinone/menaquinone biosynthesis C-methylase UbiE
VSEAATPRTAHRYDGESEWRRIGAVGKVENILSLCDAIPHRTILEIGAGEGSIAHRLGELGFAQELYALEVSESGVAAIAAREVPSLVECRLFDGYAIPYADKQFDLAILSHVVEHVENPRALLYDAKRVARYVFVEVPTEDTLRLPHDFVADDVGHINFFSPITIRLLLQSCGLEVLAQRTTNPPKAAYVYRSGGRGALSYLVKQVALRAAPAIATQLWTYHSALICRSA